MSRVPPDRIRPSPGARDMRHASVGSVCLPTALVESASARRTQRCQATGTCVRRECAPHLRRRPPRPANPPATRSQMSGQRRDPGRSARTSPAVPVPGLARSLRRSVNDGRADRISRVGHYPAHVRPGEYGHQLRRAGWLSGVPGRVQDGSRTMRSSWTQLDLMGHDPEPASR